MSRRGRPPIADSTYSLHITLSSDMYDEAFRVSLQKRVSVPEVVRRALGRLLADERSTETLAPK